MLFNIRNLEINKEINKEVEKDISVDINIDINDVIQSVKLNDSMEMTPKVLDLLYKINIAMLGDNDVQPCDEVVQLLGEYTESLACSIWLFEVDKSNRKIRKGFYCIESHDLQKLSSADFELMEKVLEVREAYFINKNKCSNNDLNISALGTPIFVHGDIVGTLNIWNLNLFETVDFSAQFLTIVSKVVHTLSLGLKNNLFDTKHNQRIKKELEIAQRIQVNLVPKSLPNFNGVSIGVRAISANEVGGDYLDLIETTNRNLGIVIGDVMGKGIPAALHMVMTRTVFRATARNDISPNLVLKEINSVLYPDLSPEGIFVTLFYGLYHPASKLLLYANAAHNPPIVYHAATGDYTLLKAKGVFIGGKENPKYNLQSVQLYSGDIIVFYSDGLKEAMNKTKEQFGIKRIVETVKKYAFYDAASITDCLYISQAKYTEDCEQKDDITFAVLKVN